MLLAKTNEDRIASLKSLSGKGHLSQMRYINLFTEYFVNMFVYKIFDFIIGNIGERFDSEMGILKNDRNKTFIINQYSINYRIL